MNQQTALIALLTLAAASATVQAAPITWSAAQNITANALADVKTNGTHVAALALGQGAAVTVNGITFDQTGYVGAIEPNYAYTGYKSGAVFADTNITVNVSGANLGSNYAADASYNGLLASKAFILQQESYTSPIILKNLTVGQSYQVQIWAANSDNQSPTLGSSGGETVALNALTGQYVLGTFTADNTGRQDLWYRSTAGDSTYAGINAISLRQVPEPASLALLALATVGLLRRRR